MRMIEKKFPSNRIRTSDLEISALYLYSLPLYQLSYRGLVNKISKNFLGIKNLLRLCYIIEISEC